MSTLSLLKSMSRLTEKINAKKKERELVALLLAMAMASEDIDIDGPNMKERMRAAADSSDNDAVALYLTGDKGSTWNWNDRATCRMCDRKGAYVHVADSTHSYCRACNCECDPCARNGLTFANVFANLPPLEIPAYKTYAFEYRKLGPDAPMKCVQAGCDLAAQYHLRCTSVFYCKNHYPC